jgi:hypothetical protein
MCMVSIIHSLHSAHARRSATAACVRRFSLVRLRHTSAATHEGIVTCTFVS